MQTAKVPITISPDSSLTALHSRDAKWYHGHVWDIAELLSK